MTFWIDLFPTCCILDEFWKTINEKFTEINTIVQIIRLLPTIDLVTGLSTNGESAK